MQRANMQYWKRYHGLISRAAYRSIVFLHQLLRVLGYGLVYAVKPAARPEAAFKIGRSAACLGWLFGLNRDRRSGLA